MASTIRRHVLTLACGAALMPVACAAMVEQTAPKELNVNAALAPSNRPHTPEIRLVRGRVWLDGKALDSLAPGALGQAALLGKALLKRGAGQDRAARTCALTVDDDADGAQWKSLLKTVANADWQAARIDAGGASVTVHLSLEPPGAEWPNSILTAVVRPNVVELWSVPKEQPSSVGAQSADPSSPAEVSARRVAELKEGNMRIDALDLLQAQCQKWSACSPVVLLVERDANAAFVGQFLRALGTAAAKQGEAAQVQLQFEEPPPAGSAPTLFQPLDNTGTYRRPGASGYLPPVEIQRVVRERFVSMRSCYEDGLRRDPSLQGKVVVRFKIGRDGTVTAAGFSSWDSTMPDADVKMCVLEHIKGLVFPPPEGGIVTVVYPIVFSPGPP